jgi:hypothetical protein
MSNPTQNPEDLERAWSTEIRNSSRKVTPSVLEFLENNLHGAYRKIAPRILDKKEEVRYYPQWLQTVDDLTDPVMATFHCPPDRVTVYGLDYLSAGGRVFRCLWTDTWRCVGETWEWVEVREEDVEDVTEAIGLYPKDYSKALQDYVAKHAVRRPD